MSLARIESLISWSSLLRDVVLDGPIPIDIEPHANEYGIALTATFLVEDIATREPLLLVASAEVGDEPNLDDVRQLVHYVYRHEADEQIRLRGGHQPFFPFNEHQ